MSLGWGNNYSAK